MKKILALVLALAMIFALAACGGNTKTADIPVDEPTPEAAAEPAEEPAAEAAPEPAEEPAEEPAGAPSEEPPASGGPSSGESSEAPADDSGSDFVYVQNKGVLVVGITDFEPMDYQDENGKWIGFDADLAREFAEALSCDVEFVEIDWDSKILELNSKAIDCVWNGMTLTDEVTSAMECSSAYCNNAQVVVVPADKADQYQTIESLEGLVFAVENGSAGQAEVEKLGNEFTAVENQAAALMEVAAGTSDAAVIDALMAAAMVGEGTGYENLTYTVSLNSEEYGVGFRKGSELAFVLDDFFNTMYENGTMSELAETYGITAALIER